MALSSVCLNASTVPMSGFGAPRFTATPMPDDMMSARLSARSLPDLIRSSIWKSTSTARSNGSPASIRRFITAATSATTTGVKPVAFSNCGRKLADDHLGHPRAEDFQLGRIGRRHDRKQDKERAERLAIFFMPLHPVIANLMPNKIASTTTAGFASANFPAISLHST